MGRQTLKSTKTHRTYCGTAYLLLFTRLPGDVVRVVLLCLLCVVCHIDGTPWLARPCPTWRVHYCMQCSMYRCTARLSTATEGGYTCRSRRRALRTGRQMHLSTPGTQGRQLHLVQKHTTRRLSPYASKVFQYIAWVDCDESLNSIEHLHRQEPLRHHNQVVMHMSLQFLLP